jgi:DNA-binding response OmpR family regulator
MARILLVGSDPTSASAVSRCLEADGCTVDWVADGRLALARLGADPPDLVVIDLVPPRTVGLEVRRRLGARGAPPVITLATGDAGRVGDDVLRKPFAPQELLDRVRARLGPRYLETTEEARRTVRAGDVVVDVAARTAGVGDRPVSLTTREVELLAFLVAHPGRTFRREELMDEVWGTRIGDRSTVTVHIRRLREKLEADPRHPERILTVWGEGYRFEP